MRSHISHIESTSATIFLLRASTTCPSPCTINLGVKDIGEGGTNEKGSDREGELLIDAIEDEDEFEAPKLKFEVELEVDTDPFAALEERLLFKSEASKTGSLTDKLINGYTSRQAFTARA
jgi:hypothetical protein